MTIYGFNKKETAQNLAAIGRQRPPSTWGSDAAATPLMHFVCLTPSGGIPARSGATLGSAKCDIYSIDAEPKLTGIEVTQDPGNGSNPGLVQLSADVLNLATGQIAGNEYRLVHQVGGNWVIEPSGVVGADIGYVRFKTTAKMSNRQVAAVIEYVITNQVNPVSGLPYAVGDPITVADPRNLFPDVEADATGTAFWYDNQKDPPDDIKRWEIQNCSLPVNEIWAHIRTCLIKNGGQGTAYFGSANSPPVANWNRAEEPNNDFPPEITEISTDEYQINFDNDFGLDAPAGAYVRLRRETDRQASDPSNETVPKPGSATAAAWKCVETTDIIARWACIQVTGSQRLIISVWEGHNPAEVVDGCSNCVPCEPPVNWGCMPPPSGCSRDGTYVASYNPDAHEYRMISSQSGLLGDAQIGQRITGPPDVQTGTGSECENDRYCMDWPVANTVVFDCPNPIGGPPSPLRQCIEGKDFLDCINVCEYICTYCDVFATSPECDPCYGECVWIWDDVAQSWTFDIDNCSDSPDCGCNTLPDYPGTSNGEEARVPCDKPPPPPPCLPNCSHCPDEQLTPTVVTWSNQQTLETYATKLGAIAQNNGDCSWTLEITWQQAGGNDTDDTATISYDGTTWSISTGGSPFGSGASGNWTTDGDCSGTWGCSGAQPGCSFTDQPSDFLTANLTVVSDNCFGQSTSLSGIFQSNNPELLSGCGCSGGVLAIMDRWERDGDITDAKIDRLADTLRNKNQDVPKADILAKIQEAIEQWRNA